MKKIILIAFFIIFSPFALNAQIIDSSFFGWSVYELKSGELDEKKCYMILHPIKSESNHNSREKPYVMITRYQDRRFEEVSIYSGFNYKNGSRILIMLDEEKMEMPTNKDMAWARTKQDDVRIIQKMLFGAKLQVRSDSDIATFAIDEYSLEGVAKAYSRLKRICD